LAAGLKPYVRACRRTADLKVGDATCLLAPTWSSVETAMAEMRKHRAVEVECVLLAPSPRIVIGNRVRIPAREVVKVERSRVRFNAGFERKSEPSQLADDCSSRMSPGVISRYGNRGCFQ
jgi:hypothetical protein